VDEIHFSRTRYTHNPDRVWIMETHGTCQVRCRISSSLTAERDDDWFEIFHYRTPSSSASSLLIT
jgi:hypothetical protein